MFYAFDNRHGINTRSADDYDRIGEVVVFNSKKDRDAYVGDNENAERISSKEARHYLLKEVIGYMGPMTEAEREDINNAPIAELVRRVERINDTFGY